MNFTFKNGHKPYSSVSLIWTRTLSSQEELYTFSRIIININGILALILNVEFEKQNACCGERL